MATYSKYVTGGIDQTVTIGSTSYPNPLEVTSTGNITPTTATDGIDGAGAGAYTLYNKGYINGGQNHSGTGAGGIGVDLSSATVTNAYRIFGGNGYGGSNGGVGVSMAGTLTNLGGTLIGGGEAYNGNGTGGVAVVFSGGTLTNDASGQIEGGSIGFGYEGAATGNGGDGIDLGADAIVKNSGDISGGGGPELGTKSHPYFGGDAVKASLSTDIITNYGGGRITGGNGYTTGGVGIAASGGVTVTNDASGLIYGGDGDGSGTGGAGVQVYGSKTTLTNDGTVQGGKGTDFADGGAGVDIASGGKVDNEFKIYGGTSYSGKGPSSFGVGVYLNGGTLITDDIIGGGGFGAGDSVKFGSAAGTITVHSAASFIGDIGGFAVGDKVDITNLTYYSGARTDLTRDAGGYKLTTPTEGTLQFDGSFTDEHFVFLPDDMTGTGTNVELAPGAACYLRGTRIHTEQGEAAIEALRIGDRVITLSGAARKIRWIGRRRYRAAYAAADSNVLPIRIRAGALGAQVPQRDLWVSPEHAMWIDGMLIPARALIDGDSIVRQQPDGGEIEYLHVEFDTHDVIWAEGAPSESFVDDDSREHFDNCAEYATLYPHAVREAARFCAPRVEDGEALEAVRRRRALQAAAPADAAIQTPEGRPIPRRGPLPPAAPPWSRREVHRGSP